MNNKKTTKKSLMTIESIASLTIDNNKLLRNILELLVEIHKDGKTQKEKDAIDKFIARRTKENLIDAFGLLIEPSDSKSMKTS
jgi:ribosomal protein L17